MACWSDTCLLGADAVIGEHKGVEEPKLAAAPVPPAARGWGWVFSVQQALWWGHDVSFGAMWSLRKVAWHTLSISSREHSSTQLGFMSCGFVMGW